MEKGCNNQETIFDFEFRRILSLFLLRTVYAPYRSQDHTLLIDLGNERYWTKTHEKEVKG
jgi:hypothetical protein